MARLGISLLAAVLLASYASAINLEEICMATVDAQYCQELLNSTVAADTDFKSVTWHKAVIDKAIAPAMNASDVITKLTNVSESYKDGLKSCSEKFESSITLLKDAAAQFGSANDVLDKVDQAAANCDACNELLDNTGEEMCPVRDAVHKAYNACLIVQDIIMDY